MKNFLSMKFLLLISSFIISQSLFSQSQHPRSPYTKWTTVYYSGTENVHVQISYSVSTCEKGRLIGYSFYRINNQKLIPKGYVLFSFDYYDCAGKLNTERVTVELNFVGVKAELGMWFMGNKVVSAPYNIKYENYDKKSKNNETDVETDLNNRMQKYDLNKDEKPSRRIGDNSLPTNKPEEMAATNVESQERDKQLAEEARVQDSLKNVARKERIEGVIKNDKAEDEAYMAAATATIGLMAFLDDKYKDDESNLKFHVGLGYESLPLIANDYAHRKSYVEVSSFPNIHLGMEGRLNLNKNGGIALQATPIFYYGWGALSAGTSGTSLGYGGNLTLFLARFSESKFQLFGEGGYLNRSGTWEQDVDAITGSRTDIIKSSSYDYSTMRYGGGFKLQFVNDAKENETYIKPGIFIEKPSNNNIGAQVVVGNLQVMIASQLMLDFSYSKNYFLAGDVAYKAGFGNEIKDYFSIKLIRKGLISPK